jgi:hypothetical protein
MLPILIAVDMETDDVPLPEPPAVVSLTGRAESSMRVQFGTGIVANTAIT